MVFAPTLETRDLGEGGQDGNGNPVREWIVRDTSGQEIYRTRDAEAAQEAYQAAIREDERRRPVFETDRANVEEGQLAAGRETTENDLLGESLGSTVGARGRRFLKKILTESPLSGQMDEEALSLYRARFNSWLEQGRTSANRLGTEIRTLAEDESGLLFTDHDREGRITIFIHPEAQKAFLSLAENRGDAAAKVAEDALSEELLHTADLVATRDEWLKLPGSRRGSFEEFVKQDRISRFNDIRMAREKATGEARKTIDGALIDAYRLYFEDEAGGRTARTADKVLEILENAPSRDVNHVSFVAEFTRMLAQASRGTNSETGFASLLEKLRAWVQRALSRLKEAYSLAEQGELGALMQERLARIESIMDEGGVEFGAMDQPSGNGTFSRFSQRPSDALDTNADSRRVSKAHEEILREIEANPQGPDAQALKSWFERGFRDIQKGLNPEAEKRINQILDRLPMYKSREPIFRGMSFLNENDRQNVLRKFGGGYWENDKPFMSASKEGRAVMRYIESSNYPVIVQILENVTGKDVEPISASLSKFGRQKEILYKKGAKFRVVGSGKSDAFGKIFYTIQLKEIP